MPQVSKFGIASNMVPDEVPEELRDLTTVEQQLIAIAHPIAKVYHKKGGQYGYTSPGT